MLKALIISRIYALCTSLVMRRGQKGGKDRSVLSTVLIMTSLALLLMFSLGTMLLPLAQVMAGSSYSWFFFAIASVIAFALCLIGSVFVSQNQLFDAKDNELLGSMPIPPRYIVISRIAGLVSYNYIYELLVMIPAGILFCIFGNVTVSGVIIYLLVCVFLPLPVLAISAFIGWLIALITAKMKRKNLISYVLMIAFIFAYFRLYSGFSGFVETLQERGGDIASTLQKALPPFYWLGTAITENNFVGLLLFLAFCVVPFAVMCALISHFYVKITTASHGVIKYKYKAEKTVFRSVGSALLMRELSRFFSLPIYVMNCGLGAMLMPIAAIIAAVKSRSLLADPTFSGILPGLICVAVCFCSIMDSTTDCSISLEGNRFWILRSLPIDLSKIINAKMYMNLLISFPSIIVSALIIGIALSFKWYMILMIIATGCVFQLFSAGLGMVSNILFPKFVWQNETVAVKQTFSVFITLFGGMIAIAIPAILYFAVFSPMLSLESFILIADGVFLLVSVLFWYLSLTWGKRRLLTYEE